MEQDVLHPSFYLFAEVYHSNNSLYVYIHVAMLYIYLRFLSFYFQQNTFLLYSSKATTCSRSSEPQHYCHIPKAVLLPEHQPSDFAVTINALLLVYVSSYQPSTL